MLHLWKLDESARRISVLRVRCGYCIHLAVPLDMCDSIANIETGRSSLETTGRPWRAVRRGCLCLRLFGVRAEPIRVWQINRWRCFIICQVKRSEEAVGSRQEDGWRSKGE